MTVELVIFLLPGIACLFAAGLLFGGAWCAARCRDGLDLSGDETPRRTPRYYIQHDRPHVYVMQDAEDANGVLDHDA